MPSRKPMQSSVPAADPIEQAALRYLARQDRTVAQVRAYLHRRNVSERGIRMVIRRFQAHGYLNDEAYALRWARARLARRPMGRARLEAELLAQGLDREIASHATEQIYGRHSERDLARALLSRHPDLRQAARAARAAGLLRRYGFSEDAIEAVVETVDPS